MLSDLSACTFRVHGPHLPCRHAMTTRLAATWTGRILVVVTTDLKFVHPVKLCPAVRLETAALPASACRMWCRACASQHIERMGPTQGREYIPIEAIMWILDECASETHVVCLIELVSHALGFLHSLTHVCTLNCGSPTYIGQWHMLLQELHDQSPSYVLSRTCLPLMQFR